MGTRIDQYIFLNLISSNLTNSQNFLEWFENFWKTDSVFIGWMDLEEKWIEIVDFGQKTDQLVSRLVYRCTWNPLWAPFLSNKISIYLQGLMFGGQKWVPLSSEMYTNPFRFCSKINDFEGFWRFDKVDHFVQPQTCVCMASPILYSAQNNQKQPKTSKKRPKHEKS